MEMCTYIIANITHYSSYSLPQTNNTGLDQLSATLTWNEWYPWNEWMPTNEDSSADLSSEWEETNTPPTGPMANCIKSPLVKCTINH